MRRGITLLPEKAKEKGLWTECQQVWVDFSVDRLELGRDRLFDDPVEDKRLMRFIAAVRFIGFWSVGGPLKLSPDAAASEAEASEEAKQNGDAQGPDHPKVPL